MARALERLARGCARHRLAVIAVWIVALTGVAIGSAVLGSLTVTDPALPGTQSQKALDLAEREYPRSPAVSSNVLYAARTGVLSAPAIRQAVEASMQRVTAAPHVRSVTSPFAPAGAAGLSEGGRIASATVHLDVPVAQLDDDDAQAIVDAATQGAPADLQVVVGGAIEGKADPPATDDSATVGLIAAAVILLLTLGSAVAMALPIATALLGLLGGLSIVTLASHEVEVASLAPTLGTMIGLGVGIDYALFVVTRFRRQLGEGMDVEDALARTVATSGASIVFAGGTVVVALSALRLARIPMVTSLGLAACVCVVVAVLAAITLLPAVLAVLGRRVDALPIGPLVRRRADRDGAPHGWRRWAEGVVRRPWASLAAGVAVLAVLALPATQLKLGMTDGGDAPRGSVQRQHFDLMTEGFGPGSTGQLILVGDLRDARPDALPKLEALTRQLRDDPGVAKVTPPLPSPDRTTALVEITATTAPASRQTQDLVRHLRRDVLGPGLAGTGVRAYLGGKTAAYADLADEISARLPVVILAVVALSVILLLLAFRSVVVPLKAAAMNLLSVAAAYGVLTAVFQWGWGTSLLGLDGDVPIVSFVPLMMFAILFGLSMDYEVFLLSRIRERWGATGDTRRSVVEGVAATGRIITAAALVMVFVFGSFILNDDPIVKQFGVGMAAAVAIDATLVRCLLVPAIMTLVGGRVWWLPRGLDRLLPHVEIEAPDAAAPSGPQSPSTPSIAARR